MTTRRRRWDVLLSAALFLLLALLFVPECDDCYFIYWDFASWKDFLLVRPIPQEGVVLGVPSNGRGPGAWPPPHSRAMYRLSYGSPFRGQQS